MVYFWYFFVKNLPVQAELGIRICKRCDVVHTGLRVAAQGEREKACLSNWHSLPNYPGQPLPPPFRFLFSACSLTLLSNTSRQSPLIIFDSSIQQHCSLSLYTPYKTSLGHVLISNCIFPMILKCIIYF